MPSQAELSFQQFKQRKKALEGASKADILAKYGNAAAAPTDDVKALQVWAVAHCPPRGLTFPSAAAASQLQVLAGRLASQIVAK